MRRRRPALTRCGSALTLLLASITGMSAIAHAQRNEIVKGRSAELDIAFELIGGKAWCAPAVRVSLTAKPGANPFTLDALPFVQMVGRIRSIIEAGCAADVRRIVFDGKSGSTAVRRFELTQLTAWRQFIELDIGTDTPKCVLTGDGDADRCRRQRAAYTFAQTVLGRKAFEAAIVSAFFEAGRPPELLWRDGNVVGKLTMTTRDALARGGATVSVFADALALAAASRCAGPTASSIPRPLNREDRGEDASLRTFACPALGVSAAQSAMITCNPRGDCAVNSIHHEVGNDDTLPELWRVARER